MTEPRPDDTIRLDQLLKLHGLVETGGHAKQVIQAGEVRVNGQTETRRGRKLRPGDLVEFGDEEILIAPGDGLSPG